MDVQNYIDSADINSIWFLPVDKPKDERYNWVHLSDDWFINQILPFETITKYSVKRQQNDIFPLQFRSTLGPVYLHIYDCSGKLIEGNIPIPEKSTSVIGQPWRIYEKEIRLNKILSGESQKIPPGTYYFFVSAGAGGQTAYLISEPIKIKEKWPDTLLLEYQHDENDFAVIWETGLRLNYRMEGILYDPEFKRVSTTYINQVQDMTLVRAIPFTKWKLIIGGVLGIPPWMGKVLNSILSVRKVWVDGLLLAADGDAEIEGKKIENYPLIHYSIDLREGINLYNKRAFATGDPTQSILIVHNINNWSYFGSLNNQPTNSPIQIIKQL